jgi:type VI secretion system secreted protein Hcp
MSVEMYMHIEGIEGTSRHRNYRGCIDVLSYTWGVTRTRSAAGKAPAHVTSGNTLSLVKMIGVDSAALMNLCASGATVPCAVLSIVPTVSRREVQQKYADITLYDVAVKSVSTSGAVEEDGIREAVELRFRKLRFEYFLPVSSDAAAISTAGESRTFECDFAAQTSTCA